MRNKDKNFIAEKFKAEIEKRIKQNDLIMVVIAVLSLDAFSLSSGGCAMDEMRQSAAEDLLDFVLKILPMDNSKYDWLQQVTIKFFNENFSLKAVYIPDVDIEKLFNFTAEILPFLVRNDIIPNYKIERSHAEEAIKLLSEHGFKKNWMGYLITNFPPSYQEKGGDTKTKQLLKDLEVY